MKGSYHEVLQPIDTLILSAGHGEGDPGACNGPYREADQAVAIVQRMAAILRPALPTGKLVTVPFALGLKKSIAWINNQYSPKTRKAWCIEIHRDSAGFIKEPDASLRCGIYHSGSTPSSRIGDSFASCMRSLGAHDTTWSRSHAERGGLAWVRQISCLSHIVELGFMEGNNDLRHLTKLADMAAIAIFKVFTGQVLHIAGQ